MQGPQGVHDGWQRLLPETTPLNCRQSSRIPGAGESGDRSLKNPTNNRPQPGYSGINRDKSPIHICRTTAGTVDRKFVARGRKFRAEMTADWRVQPRLNHAKSRVNTLKYAYARLKTGKAKYFFRRVGVRAGAWLENHFFGLSMFVPCSIHD
jgi:hypothetical protein